MSPFVAICVLASVHFVNNRCLLATVSTTIAESRSYVGSLTLAEQKSKKTQHSYNECSVRLIVAAAAEMGLRGRCVWRAQIYIEDGPSSSFSYLLAADAIKCSIRR
jgi:hypothetical protein